MALLKSGVHATIGGLIMGMLVPARPRLEHREFHAIDALQKRLRGDQQRGAIWCTRWERAPSSIGTLRASSLPRSLAGCWRESCGNHSSWATSLVESWLPKLITCRIREDLLKYGASEVIQPEIEASATLVSNVLQYLNLPGANAQAYIGALRALENYTGPLRVTANSPVLQEVAVGDFRGDGETLGEAHVRERFGGTVVAVVTLSGDVAVNPPATTSIRAGKKLRVFGLPKRIAEFAAYVGGRN